LLCPFPLFFLFFFGNFLALDFFFPFFFAFFFFNDEENLAGNDRGKTSSEGLYNEMCPIKYGYMSQD